MGILTLNQDGKYVISSDRGITDAPTNTAAKGEAIRQLPSLDRQWLVVGQDGCHDLWHVGSRPTNTSKRITAA